MANMSYCRMENTYSDLLDCYHNWRDVDSKSEKKYRSRLLDLCAMIVDDFRDWDEDEDEYDEDAERDDDDYNYRVREIR